MSWATLDGAIDGDVAVPDSPRYEDVRAPAIARFAGVRPHAVVSCTSPADIAETLTLARRSGLPVVPRSGGHCFAGRSTSPGVVIDVARLNDVSVTGGVAFVGAGARLGPVYDALDAHGLTLPAGCGPTVGIAGLTLGGGLGILGRAYGLTCDSLRAAEVVLADGRVVVCDRHHEPDLFWALRGAGARGFGVVTTLVFDTLPAPAMTAFRLTWPPGLAAAVIDAWQRWAPDAPDELAASLLVTVPPAIDEPPDVAVFGATIGSDGAPLGELVARVGADPATAELLEGAHREVKRHLAGDGDDAEDGIAFIKSEYFAQPLPAAAVAALVRHLTGNRVGGEARELDFTPWGGAYNRVAPEETAFVQRRERFLLKHTATIGAGAPEVAARRWVARSFAHTRPWGSGTVYPNFPEPELDDVSAAHYGANQDRLLRVRSAYSLT